MTVMLVEHTPLMFIGGGGGGGGLQFSNSAWQMRLCSEIER